MSVAAAWNWVLPATASVSFSWVSCLPARVAGFVPVFFSPENFFFSLPSCPQANKENMSFCWLGFWVFVWVFLRGRGDLGQSKLQGSMFSAHLWHTMYQSKSLQVVWISPNLSKSGLGNARVNHGPLCASQKCCMVWKCASNHQQSCFLSNPSAYVYLYNSPRVFWHCHYQCVSPQGGNLAARVLATVQGTVVTMGPLGAPNWGPPSADFTVALRADTVHNETIYKHLK